MKISPKRKHKAIERAERNYQRDKRREAQKQALKRLDYLHGYMGRG